MLSLTDLAVSPAEATGYIAARGHDGWPEDEADQTAPLLRGQVWIALRCNRWWAEEWTDPPEDVRHAIIEAALREAREPGVLAPDYRPADQVVSTAISGPAGSANETYRAGTGPSDYTPRFPIIDKLLAPHLDLTVRTLRY